MLGFHVGIWDFVTFGAIFIIVAAGLAVAVFVLGLPGRIAVARKHPEAEAVYLMGWVEFLAIVPWIQALGWAFKPTTVIDIRYLPEEEKRQTEAMIARLAGTDATRRTARQGHDIMIAALLVLSVACAAFWLVFLHFKLIRLTSGWGIALCFFCHPPDACLPDRFAVRNSLLHKCSSRSADYSACSSPAGTNARDGSAR